MNSVLVTLRGPEGDEDLVAPADTSVDRLIPALLDMVAPPGRNGNDADWELASPGKPPLADEQTLAEQGVVDGSVLMLRRRGEPYAVEEDTPQTIKDGLLPLERTRALLPERIGPVIRVRAALEAGRRRDDRSVRERIRGNWEETSYLSSLDRRIQAPRLEGTVTIAVVSPEGAGASTVTALVGSLLAARREDRVLAVHAADLGGLGVGAPSFGSDLREIGLRRSTDGLLALAGPTRLAAPADAGEDEYADAVRRLQSIADLLLIDCGGEETAAQRGAIAAADQIVLVCDAGTPESRARARSLRPLESAAPQVVVVNRQLRIRPRLDLGEVQRRAPEARGLIALNSDRVAAERLETGRFSWESGPAGTWPRSVRELAVVLASGWGESDRGSAG